ncbi:hypothetical protein HFP51_11735 [Parasphingopyxis sp. CP4]|uniref:T4SS efffector SepA family protein n=1 Tax=Parasphingopyxis sp. CP4 TaxID=2724527 RepID=UPI0015A25580|nr:hypothetical protein [Parasphingopyxis sp. CP4]QLC22791.1 hypothetical protein HFP51_11735 [Parasphingopyxis sp. CP4]
MSHLIEIPNDLFARLQKQAIPLVDTTVSVIERALDALEDGSNTGKRENKSVIEQMFEPRSPPDLKFTGIISAKVAGKALPISKCYWNSVLLEVILEAWRRGASRADILDLITVNSQTGKREDSGFKYLQEVDISVQGQDANGAWRQAYQIASGLGIDVEVHFHWQNTPSAQMPGIRGAFFTEELDV